jgi:hypothetical protein
MRFEPDDPEGQREIFLYWWPVLARLVGIIGAFIEAGYAIATHQPADAGFLVFCGTLIVAPIIFDQQDRRNRRRRLYVSQEEEQEAPPFTSSREQRKESPDAEDR